MRIAALRAVLVVALIFSGSPASATSYRHHRALHQLATIDRALQSFYHDVGRFPTSEEGIEALVDAPPGLSSWGGPYIQSEELLDPWGVDLAYGHPAVHGNLAFDLYCLGRNAKDEKGEGDDLSNWAYFDSKQYPVGEFWNDALMWVLLLDLPAFLLLCGVVVVVRRSARGRGSRPRGSLTEPLQPTRAAGPNDQREPARHGPRG